MVGTAVSTATVENRLGRTRQTLSLLPQMRDARSKVGHLTNGSSAHTPPRLGPENAKKVFRCLGEKKDQFCFKISSTLPWCSVLGVPSELLLGQASPGSTTFVSLRAEAELGEVPAVLETPKQQQPGSTTCVLQKNPYSPPSPILLISPRFAQTGNCY